MKKVAIIQSSYIPWKGYFDIIHAVDIFIFLEDVQYTVRDWRNRNKIKALDGGTKWLSVPNNGTRHTLISEVKIDYSQNWQRKHLEVLRHTYRKAPFFASYHERLSELYENEPRFLSQMNIMLTKEICRWLGIRTTFYNSCNLLSEGKKDDKLIDLIKTVGGDSYLSGPRAKDYIDRVKFEKAGIELAYQDYSGYPEYGQVTKPFDHFVSVLDLLFMKGDEAPEYIWGRYRRRE